MPPRATMGRGHDHPAHGRSRYALDYTTCSTDELFRFVQDRKLSTSLHPARQVLINALTKFWRGDIRHSLGLQSPRDYDKQTTDELWLLTRVRELRVEEELRSAMVQALKEADRTAKFRFMDLAGELQNQIYEELLLLQDWSVKEKSPMYWSDSQLPRSRIADTYMFCFPQILATCRKIHNDASGILYSINSPTVRLIGSSHASGLSIQGRIYHIGRFKHATSRWPPYLLKLRSLTFDASERPPILFANKPLRSLSCFLGASATLEEVVVKAYDFGGLALPALGSSSTEGFYTSGELCEEFVHRFHTGTWKKIGSCNGTCDEPGLSLRSFGA